MTGFWILAGLIAIVTIGFIGRALLSSREDGAAAAAYDVQVYRDQLKELDRDVARGVMGEAEAERARLEISRRLLEADRKAQAGSAGSRAPRAATLTALGLSGLLLIGGGYWLYADLGAPGYWDMPLKSRFEAASQARANRPSQAEAEADLPHWAGPPPQAPAEYVDLVQKLRETVAEHPDDLQGQLLLASHENALGNHVAAAKAMARVIEIKGDQATAEDYSRYADLLVVAAAGYVSPEAEAAINQALALDPQEQVARFYAGLLHRQTGRPDLAFRIWRDLLESSDPSDPWVEPILADIMTLAAMAGVDYTPPNMTHALSGPSAADIAAAADMTPEQRAEMINNMVGQLMERLANEGGTADEWARLISALGVQGDIDRAEAIWGEARVVFAARPQDLALIDAAAAGAGLGDPLPFEPGPGSGPEQPQPELRGPTQDDIAAAQDMTPEEQAQMIDGMVTRLSDELATDGGPPARWNQLFRALAVLGEPERAKAAWAEAQKAFADDPAGLAQIREAAAAAGAVE